LGPLVPRPGNAKQGHSKSAVRWGIVFSKKPSKCQTLGGKTEAFSKRGKIDVGRWGGGAEFGSVRQLGWKSGTSLGTGGSS